MFEALFNQVTAPMELFFKNKEPSSFRKKFPCRSPATLLKETPARVLPCEICTIFENTYFEEHLRTTACERKIIKKQ